MEQWYRVIGIGCMAGLAMLAGTRAADAPEEEPEQPIAAVQALLRQERLYSGPVDGVAGKDTVAAIRRYQILHGLRATGRLEPETLRAMLLPTPAPSGALAASDREFLRELAQTPVPEVVAEPRKPIPPGEPVATPPTTQKPGADKSKKNGRSKANKSRRTENSRLSAD